MRFSKVQRRYLVLIIAGFVFLAITYALATPPLEASDEYKHYPVVQYIRTHGRQPVLDPVDPGKWLQEAAQPPLYYFIMAGLTVGIDSSDLVDLHQINPHAFIGDPNQYGNKNLIIHEPEREQFPWHGSVLAIYLVRFATILIGVGTILLVARLGSLLFSPQTGLLAAALTAFNPMFLFVSAAVNNDGLAILLGTLGLYMLVKLWRDEPDPIRRWYRYASLGLILGLGILTKLSLSGLLPLTALALALLTWRRRKWEYFILGGLIVLLTSLIFAAPWFIRNMRLYGDPSALNVFMEVQTKRLDPIVFQDWIGEFGTLYRSFWGLFGGVNIPAPEIYYLIYNLLAIAGIAGFIYWMWRRYGNRGTPGKTSDGLASNEQESETSTKGLWLLFAWAAIVFVLLVRWNLYSQAFQGRLLFPALGALNVLWSAGLQALLPRRFRPRVVWILSGVLFIMAALLPWTVIRPVYAIPEPVSNVPEEALFGPISFRTDGDEILLVGVEVAADQTVTPGGNPVEVVLYWQATGFVDQNYLSAVHLLGRGNNSVGFVNRYPANGMVPSSEWRPGEIWRDVYHVTPGSDAVSPSRLRFKAGLFDNETKRDLDAFGPGGEPIDLLIVGEARLASDDDMGTLPESILDVAFADSLTLLGYDLETGDVVAGDTIPLALHWQASGSPSKEYTVFVHLLDDSGEQIAGADGPPVNGDYPTNLWRAGEIIIDEHSMHLPAELPFGTYQISVGLYDPTSLARVSRLDGAGDAVTWRLILGGDG